MTAIAATEVARQWTITTANGFTARGYLPKWADADPSAASIPADQLELHLADLTHHCGFGGMGVEAHVYSSTPSYEGTVRVLCPQMVCDPYSSDPARRVPTVTVELVEGGGDWIENLDPVQVCELADKLRAHADALDDMAAHLQDAREDWAKHGGTAATA